MPAGASGDERLFRVGRGGMGMSSFAKMKAALGGSLLFGGALAASVLGGIAGPASSVAAASSCAHGSLASVISGLTVPAYLAVSDSDLFVVNYSSGSVGEYTTSGATVNASLVTGLSKPMGIAVSGSDLFVANAGGDTVGE